MRVHILVIEDDSVLNQLLVAQIEAFGYAAQGVRTWAAAQSWMEANEPDLLVLDCRLPDADGLELLSRLGHIQPVVMLTAFASVQNAVQAIKGGAAEYLVKPINLDELEVVLKRALETAQLRKENQFLKRRVGQTSHVMVGSSKPLSEVNRLIDAVAPSDMTVLIQGESGVGKELVAHAIHARSKRVDQPFVPVDCCVLQKQLFESELFGHEKGAFTSAEQQKKGLIEGARGGTLFLDEIGEIEAGVQAKLLRTLETGRFRRVGGTRDLDANVRIVAATNRDLAAMSREGTFRADLFYRLEAFVITVPPLRERREDIADLAMHFIRNHDFSRRIEKVLSPKAVEVLTAYDWPGNIRELRNVVERAIILSGEQAMIAEEHLAISSDRRRAVTPTVLPILLEREPTLEEVKREYLKMLLGRYNGHRSKVAKALGVSERNTYRLIRR
ncbi:MAG: sigma-54-dependent Fis family transcriptional regulator, partial [Alphaproteobacteria bacterium]|nr:sigma-54-dependent Fis family transcriptional regulator [Alphaproteobacteria bacterium]